MSNPASFSSPRQYLAFHSSLSRRSVDAVISSSTFSAPATITGATELEKRNGRARWRHISTSSRRPLTQPPEAPPADAAAGSAAQRLAQSSRDHVNLPQDAAMF